MSDPTSTPDDDPPLVTRPVEQGADAPRSPALKKPRPGIWEAVLWCFVFVAGQICGAILAVVVVFAAYTFAAPNPGQFLDEQLNGFTKALDPNAQGERPQVPSAFGQAIAWGMLAAQFTSLALIALVLPRRIGPDWKRQIGVRRPSGLHVLLVLLIVPGFLIISGVVQELFLYATGIRPPPAMRALNDVFREFPWPLTVLAVAIGPGVVEELWCRGFLGRGLSARYGLAFGVFLTSALFAAMHVDPSQLFVITVMGAYLHFVYIVTRCIWMSILLHAMNNGISILLVLTLQQEQLDTDKQVPFVVSLVALVVMIFGSVGLWTSRAELHPEPGVKDEGQTAGDWKPEYPGVSAPPEGAKMRLGYAVVSPVAVIFTVISFGLLIYLGYRYLI